MTNTELLDEALWLLRKARRRLDAGLCCGRTVGRDKLLAKQIDVLLDTARLLPEKVKRDSR